MIWKFLIFTCKIQYFSKKMKNLEKVKNLKKSIKKRFNKCKKFIKEKNILANFCFDKKTQE